MILRVPSLIPFLALVTSNERCWVISAKRRRRCGYAGVRGGQQNSGAAATVLFKLMADPATPPSIRARTAQCVLECANRSLELEDIEVRLARLEQNAQPGRGDID